MIKIPVSLGELYDKLSILNIKLSMIQDPKKIKNIRIEKQLLSKISADHKIDPQFYFDLFNVNRAIWLLEDSIRLEHKNKDYSDDFIKVAIDIFTQNDKRSRIKKEINLKYNSGIIEEKSYKE